MTRTGSVKIGAVIGRQPATRTIAPSRSYPWYGTVQPDRRFTVQQDHFLRAIGGDPDTVEAIRVRREATSEEMYWPRESSPPVFAFDCPVLTRRADGRVKVIAPSGENKIVLADGWVRAPRGVRRSMFW